MSRPSWNLGKLTIQQHIYLPLRELEEGRMSRAFLREFLECYLNSNSPLSITFLANLLIIYPQPLVVRQYRIPPHRRHLRSHGISVQYMCLSRTLESLHTARSSRAKRCSNRRPKMVRAVPLYMLWQAPKMPQLGDTSN